VANTTVLVVDDDVGMVETLVDILSANGYDVAAAHSGGAAISMVSESHYDVALMDIQMPGVNGVEALKTIRTVAPHLTVIMMTAFTSDELVEEARQASAVAVLFKPFDIARVLDLISSSARPGGPRGARA
jgi:CheY-like chemotaxis protein